MTDSEQKYVKQLEIRITMYEKTINSIDDYFEYRHDSDKDKKFVMGVLDRMARNLKGAFHKCE